MTLSAEAATIDLCEFVALSAKPLPEVYGIVQKVARASVLTALLLSFLAVTNISFYVATIDFWGNQMVLSAKLLPEAMGLCMRLSWSPVHGS